MKKFEITFTKDTESGIYSANLDSYAYEKRGKEKPKQQKGKKMTKELFKNVNTGVVLDSKEYFLLYARDVQSLVLDIAKEVVEDSDERREFGDMFEILLKKLTDLANNDDDFEQCWDDDEE